MQHTTSHQVRSLTESILHHLLGSFERDEQRSSVKKLSKLWVLRSFSKFAKCSTRLSSSKIFQKVHLTLHDRSFERDEQSSWVKKFSKLWILRTSTQPVIKQDLSESASYTTWQKFRKGWAVLIGQQVLEALNSENQHTTSHQASSLETASYTTFLKFANSNTQLVIKQDLSESLSHHLLRSFERDEQHSSVQKFLMLWILRTFLELCKMQYKPVIKQDLVEV